MTMVFISTSAGVFTAHFSNEGLAKLEFPKQTLRSGKGQTSIDCGTIIRKWSALTKAALDAVFAGKAPSELPPLDVRGGTDFQRSVWSAMQRIPTGRTKSYSEIAAEIGAAKATRAVGQACGANPIPVLIPCHRVLAAGGKLGGFSSGLDWKRRLLLAEAVGNREANVDMQQRLRI